jgi:hypothetical protein
MKPQSSNEIQISLLLGSGGLLLSWLLFNQLSMALWWMPILMVILSVGSIVCLVIGLTFVLRRHNRIRNLLVRVLSLSVGLVFLKLAYASLNPLNESITRSDIFLTVSMFAPAGIILLLFGLGVEFWIAKALKVNHWVIYRYTIRLLCFSSASAMASYLIFDNGFHNLAQKDPLTFRRFIAYCIMFSCFSLGFNPWEKYFKSKEKS